MSDTVGSGTPYDIEIKGSGEGWNGTLNMLIAKLVSDITDDGPYGPVEVSLDDGSVTVGTVDVGSGDDVFILTEPGRIAQVIEIDNVIRVRV